MIFGEFKFALRDQSDQESEGVVPVSLRDKDGCVEVYMDHPPTGLGAFWKEKPITLTVHLAHTHTHIHTQSHTHTFTHTHTHFLSHSQTYSHSLFSTHSHTYTHTDSLSHALKHTLSPTL